MLQTDMERARFWAKVEKSNEAPCCWTWAGYRNRDGYGRFMLRRRVEGAHRVAYTALVGPVAVGLELDHLCRNRACVNPAHMEAVSHAENVRRGNWRAAALESVRRRRKGVCPRGHAMTGDNLYVQMRVDAPGGMRSCRRCRSESARRSYEKKRRRDAP